VKGSWIEQLFASELFIRQVRAAGRFVPAQDELERLLRWLDEGGGTLTVKELARRFNLPEDFAAGLVNSATRVLNTEARQCLVFDHLRVTLAYAPLIQQFGLSIPSR